MHQFKARPFDAARYRDVSASTPSPLLSQRSTPAPGRRSSTGRRDLLEGKFSPAQTRQERINAARAAREVRAHVLIAVVCAG
jgi:hypothetical protein